MPNRIALAKQYGCDVIVDFTKENPVEAILKLTGGKGVDSALRNTEIAPMVRLQLTIPSPEGQLAHWVAMARWATSAMLIYL